MAAFQSQSGQDISTLLVSNQTNKREAEIQTRRLDVQRLIDIVLLFIGRQGTVYRGGKSEGAHSLDYVENHGNFLELVMLVANYDVILQNHVIKCIEDRKKQRLKIRKKREAAGKSAKGEIGRGSLLTFFVKKLHQQVNQDNR